MRIFYRHLEFSLVDTTGMSEQQRREISYTVIQSQGMQQQNILQSINRLDNNVDTSAPRYDDLRAAFNFYSHPPTLEDETESVVIV